MNGFNLSYLIIPLISVLVSTLGGYFSARGMAWYKTLNLPAATPPKWVFAPMWNTIFILTTISALLAWNNIQNTNRLYVIMCIFAFNAFCNTLWSYLFFYHQMIGATLIDCVCIWASILALILLLWPEQRLAAMLLLPYFGWVSYATYLNFVIWQLN